MRDHLRCPSSNRSRSRTHPVIALITHHHRTEPIDIQTCNRTQLSMNAKPALRRCSISCINSNVWRHRHLHQLSSLIAIITINVILLAIVVISARQPCTPEAFSQPAMPLSMTRRFNGSSPVDQPHQQVQMHQVPASYPGSRIQHGIVMSLENTLILIIIHYINRRICYHLHRLRTYRCSEVVTTNCLMFRPH